MAVFNPLSHAFGLDIGDRSFKIAQISRTRSRKKPYKLTAWGEIEVDEGVMDRGDILDMAKASDAIKKLLKQCKGHLQGRGVVACLPEAKTFIKIIEVAADVSDTGLRKEVVREIIQNIPLPPDEIYYDWQVLDVRTSDKKKDKKRSETRAEKAAAKRAKKKEEKEKKDKKKRKDDKDEAAEKTSEEPEKTEEPPAAPPATVGTVRVLIGAAPKKLVDSYTTMLENAGLAPTALEIEATAISRAVMPIERKPDAPAEAVGILDIGATRSSLVIYDSGIIQMSISIPISGIAITKAISEALNVSMEDAETLKKECGLDSNRCEDKMWRILLPLIDDMTEKIRNALRFYKVGFPQGKKIETLYLCGGGAHFREIDTVLSRKLTIKVERGQALTNLHDAVPRRFPKEQALTFATAIGLGIRAADENKRNRNKFS